MGDVQSNKRPMEDDEVIQDVKLTKKMKKKHMDPAVLKFRVTVQRCCGSNDLETAMKAYNEAIEAGTKIEAQSFYNLLSLCDGLVERVHVGKPKHSTAENGALSTTTHICGDQGIDLETRKAFADGLKQQMDVLQLPLSEAAYTALIRLVSKVDVSEAEKLLDEADGVQQCRPKLRMFSPLLIRYCTDGSLEDSLRVWKRLSKHGLVLSERECAPLVQCATKFGDAAVMHRLLSDLSEDVLVPSKETCNAIIDWFWSPSSVRDEVIASTPSKAELLLEDIVNASQDVASIGCVQTTAKLGWTVSDACAIDPKTGELLSGCLKGERLRPVRLSEQAWDEMRTMNAEIVVSGRVDGDVSQFQGGRKGRKQSVGEGNLNHRQRHWRDFQQYLDRRTAIRKLDVVIDGANVGYMDQNFAGAPRHVDYNQIDWVVRYFLEQRKSVLLVLHSRHFAPNLMPRHAESIVRAWNENFILYATPPGMNDDWFWLHAALVSGSNTLVVTNDEMRDHHFQMLAPRSFLRWKERHQVRLSFGGWMSTTKQREVLVQLPDVYSRRIQSVADGLVIPLPKRGDEGRYLDGSHVADESAPDEETYVCLRPNHSSSTASL